MNAHPKAKLMPIENINTRLQLRVNAIRFEAEGIHSFELVNPDRHSLPHIEAGAHIDVHLTTGIVRPYSLAGNPVDRNRWIIGVLREQNGRGGSQAMHEKVRVGDLLYVGQIRNAFPLSPNARHTILLAGGIGITPLKSMAHTLVSSGASFELYYCVRSEKNAAFLHELRSIVPENKFHLHLDDGDPTKGLDIKELLTKPQDNYHVYFCGPAGFMKACEEATQHWPTESIHSEHFKPPQPSSSELTEGGFEIHLIRSGAKIYVQPDQTIIRAIELTGRRVPASCLSGLCGTCKVNYLDGEVDHRDYILSDDERSRCLTVCVSRASSKSLSLDL